MGNLKDGLKINGENYNFAKNAIISGEDKASLTSGGSGIVKAKNIANYIDGRNVNRNLTFTGSTENETLIGGKKKTVFKGGGGDDIFIGGSGFDTFFCTKGDKGDVVIQKFEFGKDDLRIADGTISEISTVVGGVKFEMTNANKRNPQDMASFLIESGGTTDPSKVLIKANSTYYWFATADDVTEENELAIGELITTNKTEASGKATSGEYNVIDLTYSTNLIKSGVAKQIESKTKS